jgi:tetratricopeptide (TPR) repeat protein
VAGHFLASRAKGKRAVAQRRPSHAQGASHGWAMGVLLLLALPLWVGCGSFAAQGLNADGVRLYDQARYQEAVDRFEAARNNDPLSADAYYNLAAVYHRLGKVNHCPSDLAQAERNYFLCLDHDPNHVECYRGLAVLLAEEGQQEEAFRLIQSWAARNPRSPLPKIELARLSEELGDRQAAKQHLADALTMDATNARAWAAMGHLHEQEGNPAAALTNYQQSLAADRFQQDVAARVASLQAAGCTR